MTKVLRLNGAIHHWRVKGVIQNTLSLAPGGRWVNNRLQTALGDLRAFETNIGLKVNDWVDMMTHLGAIGRGNVAGMRIMEIGSGWYPTLPLCFALAGAASVDTVDTVRHMNERLVFRMRNALEPHLARIAQLSGRGAADVRRDYGEMRQAVTVRQLLATARVRYYAPHDAADAHWIADDALDMVYSNSVFEHVDPAAIPGIMAEARRVLKPGGLMLHEVACNDHYAHFDRSISFVNYLQFEERQWRRWNNRLNYQNRLRAPDFVRLASAKGFRILLDERAERPGTREALAGMRLAREFAGYAMEDLAATSLALIGAKPEAPPS
jgi:SAM-dependent methyltransferase